MPATFAPTRLPEVHTVVPQLFGDARGSFFESFKASEFEQAGLVSEYVQENQSSSQQHVVRGFHYQKPPKSQTKLVRVIAGTILDIVVDIRPGSPRFGQFHSEILSAENRIQLYVPGGFAHGFQVLSDTATVVYRTDAEYAPDLEGGIIWNDPTIAFNWEIESPILSARDVKLPALQSALESGELDCFAL